MDCCSNREYAAHPCEQPDWHVVCKRMAGGTRALQVEDFPVQTGEIDVPPAGLCATLVHLCLENVRTVPLKPR